jgi:hypothetical protein
MEKTTTQPSPTVTSIIIPQPFELFFPDSGSVRAGSEYALADWNLRRASFCSLVRAQLTELLSDDFKEAQGKIERAILEEGYEKNARAMIEKETWKRIETPYDFPVLPLKPPFEDQDQQMIVGLAGGQLADFANMAFSRSTYSRQLQGNDVESACEVLNRYQLSAEPKPALKGHALIYRTIIVRLVDAMRLLRGRGLRNFSVNINSHIDRLISRDRRVITPEVFEHETKDWGNDDLGWILDNLGGFAKEVLQSGEVPETLGQASLEWFYQLPQPMIHDTLRLHDREYVTTRMKETPQSKHITTVSQYKEYALDLVIAMSDNSFSGFGYFSEDLDNPENRERHKEEFFSKAKPGIRRHYGNLAKALASDGGDDLRTRVPCNEIQTIDAIIKSWRSQGINFDE